MSRDLALAFNGWGRGSITVTPATPKRRYGIAVGARRRTKLLHLPAAVKVAWVKGQPVGTYADWMCGGYTYQAQFVDDPTAPGTALCSRCIIQAALAERD